MLTLVTLSARASSNVIESSSGVSSVSAGVIVNPAPAASSDALTNKHDLSWLMAYKTNYVLPFYYNPDLGTTPGAPFDKLEMAFQFSFKVPLLTNWGHNPGQEGLFVGYTQKSYWQAYGNSAFFRETNYSPELFFSKKLTDSDGLTNIQVGAQHQSNGRGGLFERSWDRVYGEFVLKKKIFSLDTKLWYVVPDAPYNRYNPNMRDYMGNSLLTLAVQLGPVTASLSGRNYLESSFKRGGSELTLSTPISPDIRIYAEAFTGYGQSLIDYDYRTTAGGLGIAFNDKSFSGG